MARTRIPGFKVMFLVLLLRESRAANIGQKLGLYGPTDKLQILTNENFKTQLYNKPHAWIVEFYNSWCGHCRRFAPEWKEFGAGVETWQNIVRVGAIDCAADENADICRDFEILGYPTIKFFSENYQEGPKMIGLNLRAITANDCLAVLVQQLKVEQSEGRGRTWPALVGQNFTNPSDPWKNVPSKVGTVIVVFEVLSSVIGATLAIDLMNITDVKIWSVADTSQLYKSLGVNMPAVYSFEKTSFAPLEITMRNTRRDVRNDVIKFLKNSGVDIPNGIATEPTTNTVLSPSEGQIINFPGSKLIGNTVFQSDLEGGLRYSLVHEIPAMKEIKGDALMALKLYLQVLIKYFPSKSNTRPFLVKLNEKISEKNVWIGLEVQNLINKLEAELSPVYSSTLQWIGCKGSSPKYRGFTCSLWTIFHVLTVGESLDDIEGDSKVLNAMLGYVKFFFGCTDCSDHFQKMVQRHTFNSFTGKDRFNRWLWFAHNQVNIRLANDITEDPQFPKKQFPYERDCPQCRYPNGNWNMDQVMIFYKNMYSIENIHQMETKNVHSSSTSTMSKFDMTIMGFLYVYCFIALVFIIRLFFSKSYKKKVYIHDTFGKV